MDRQHDAEHDGDADVEGRPPCGLLQRRLVRLADVEEEVECEQAADHDKGDGPNPQGHIGSGHRDAPGAGEKTDVSATGTLQGQRR